MPRINSDAQSHPEIGERIKALRGDLSQAEFAVRLGVDRKSVSGWETGKRLPDGAALVRLMIEFGADLNAVLGGVSHATAETPSTPVARELHPRQRALLENYDNTDEQGRRIIEAAATAAAQPKPEPRFRNG